jgi:hypothetical protein
MNTTVKVEQLETFICDATGVDMVEFSMTEPDTMIGGTLVLNHHYCGIADGCETHELHFSSEVIGEIARFLLSKYPDLKDNELVQDCANGI